MSNVNLKDLSFRIDEIFPTFISCITPNTKTQTNSNKNGTRQILASMHTDELATDKFIYPIINKFTL